MLQGTDWVSRDPHRSGAAARSPSWHTAVRGDRGPAAHHRGYQVIQQLPGIGPVPAAAIIAGIGDVTRFNNTGELLLGRPDPASASPAPWCSTACATGRSAACSKTPKTQQAYQEQDTPVTHARTQAEPGKLPSTWPHSLQG